MSFNLIQGLELGFGLRFSDVEVKTQQWRLHCRAVCNPAGCRVHPISDLVNANLQPAATSRACTALYGYFYCVVLRCIAMVHFDLYGARLV